MILIVGYVDNHSTFYDAIASCYSDVSVESVPEKFDFSKFVFLLKSVVVKNKSTSVFIEEYCHAAYLWLIFCVFFCGQLRSDVYLCVHNANKWIFAPKRISASSVLRHVLRRQLLKVASGVIVVCESMREYFSGFESLPVRVVPFRLAEDYKRTLTGVPVFVIPGNVEDKRRDYLTVLRAIRLLQDEGLRFQVHFLGVFMPERLSSTVLALVDEVRSVSRDSLVTYSDRVSDDDFDAVLRQSSALIGNLKKYFVGDDNTEIYGLTKETGIRVIADSLNIPCIISRGISPGKNLDLYLAYESPVELANAMKSFL